MDHISHLKGKQRDTIKITNLYVKSTGKIPPGYRLHDGGWGATDGIGDHRAFSILFESFTLNGVRGVSAGWLCLFYVHCPVSALLTWATMRCCSFAIRTFILYP